MPMVGIMVMVMAMLAARPSNSRPLERDWRP
jgi:hypothetical protein